MTGVTRDEPRVETVQYSACPILVSSSCKPETGAEHAALINTGYLASHKSKFRVISIASNGKS